MILLKGPAKNDLELRRNHIVYHGHIKRIQFFSLFAVRCDPCKNISISKTCKTKQKWSLDYPTLKWPLIQTHNWVDQVYSVWSIAYYYQEHILRPKY